MSLWRFVNHIKSDANVWWHVAWLENGSWAMAQSSEQKCRGSQVAVFKYIS